MVPSDWILCIDTSTHICSVAMFNDEALVGIRETSDFHSHTEQLTIFIQECIEEANIKLSDLKAIGIADGPGSYTGLRIGASTAKGLCYGLDIPLVAVGSLECLAWGVQGSVDEDYFIAAAIDARREEVYVQLFDSMMHPVSPLTPLDLEVPTSIMFFDHQQYIVCGNGADKIIKHRSAGMSLGHVQSSAQYMIRGVKRKLALEQVENIITYSPNYLKNPNITKRVKNIL